MLNDRTTHGYALVELMFVIAVIGVLLFIAIASFMAATSSASAAACASSRNAMTRAVEMYFAETGSYPGDIDDMQSFVRNWASASRCPTGPSLIYDTATHDIVCPVHGQ